MAALFSMAEQETLSDLQTEAAATIAHIAETDESKAEQLCKPNNLDHLQMLLKSDRPDIAYPTARALCNLVATEQFGKTLLEKEHNILNEMVAKISTEETNLIIQED